jgi:hypothetical protein
MFAIFLDCFKAPHDLDNDATWKSTSLFIRILLHSEQQGNGYQNTAAGWVLAKVVVPGAAHVGLMSVNFDVKFL